MCGAGGSGPPALPSERRGRGAAARGWRAEDIRSWRSPKAKAGGPAGGAGAAACPSVPAEPGPPRLRALTEPSFPSALQPFPRPGSRLRSHRTIRTGCGPAPLGVRCPQGRSPRRVLVPGGPARAVRLCPCERAGALRPRKG